jgi:hypothetical protein
MHPDVVFNLERPRGKSAQIHWFPSPREASQELYVLIHWSQRLPLYHKILYSWMPVVYQGVQ